MSGGVIAISLLCVPFVLGLCIVVTILVLRHHRKRMPPRAPAVEDVPSPGPDGRAPPPPPPPPPPTTHRPPPLA